MQTRRERVRQAAIDEIKTIAWETANTEGVEHVTVNGIARKMGMTAPAFYSYFKSRDELVRTMTIDAYRSYHDALVVARDSLPESNSAGRIFRVYMAYRDWSIQNPSMFGLFAGRRVHGFQHKDPDIMAAAEKGYGVFVNLFEKAWQQGLISVEPLHTKLPKSYQAGFELNRDKWTLKMPLEIYYQFTILAVTVHGMISIELSNRFTEHIGDLEAFYRYQILDLMRRLGIQYTSED